MKTKKAIITEGSLIYNYLPMDYSDAFECTYVSTKEVKADDVQIAFWSAKPTWINWLFKLRNLLVKPFKLDANEDKQVNNLKETIMTGKAHGNVSIPAKSENETILRMDDKHLTFYVSVQVKERIVNSRSVIVSTLVHYNNKLGKYYFSAICPFHRLIVRNMLMYVIKNNYQSNSRRA